MWDWEFKVGQAQPQDEQPVFRSLLQALQWPWHQAPLFCSNLWIEQKCLMEFACVARAPLRGLLEEQELQQPQGDIRGGACAPPIVAIACGR